MQSKLKQDIILRTKWNGMCERKIHLTSVEVGGISVPFLFFFLKVNLFTIVVDILHSHIKHLVCWCLNFLFLESSYRTSPEVYVTLEARVQI